MAVSPDDMGWLDKLGVLTGGLDKKLEPFGGSQNLGLALLANSGYSQTPRTFGQTLGVSALQAQQHQLANQKTKQDQEEFDLLKQYRNAQIQALQAKPATTPPSSVAEFEYAKRDGFKGSFQDWIVAGGQSSRPSSVQEWDFYSGLPAEMQKRYLEMKRNPNMMVKDVGSVPTVIAPSVSGTTVTPLSSLPREAAAAGTIKQAEATGGAIGSAIGGVQGGIQTKGANAQTVQGMLDIADPLIDAATGSAMGAGVDRLAAFFGKATTGAEATAQLQVLQAGLMTNMPRMEGPQSDADVALYRQAAGQIGDPTVPGKIKKSAVKAIRALQQKYQDRANTSPTGYQVFPNGSPEAKAGDAANINSLLDKYAPR